MIGLEFPSQATPPESLRHCPFRDVGDNVLYHSQPQLPSGDGTLDATCPKQVFPVKFTAWRLPRGILPITPFLDNAVWPTIHELPRLRKSCVGLRLRSSLLPRINSSHRGRVICAWAGVHLFSWRGALSGDVWILSWVWARPGDARCKAGLDEVKNSAGINSRDVQNLRLVASSYTVEPISQQQSLRSFLVPLPGPQLPPFR